MSHQDVFVEASVYIQNYVDREGKMGKIHVKILSGLD